MRQFLLQLKGLSPAAALTWLELGAERIHELPYRFAAWLPKAPGQCRRAAKAAWAWLCRTETAQEVTAIYGWMEGKADSIHELPYRFAAWLPSAPGLLLHLGRRVLQWLHDTETAQEVRAIGRWMERKAAAIHEAPYRLAAWLPTVPGH